MPRPRRQPKSYVGGVAGQECACHAMPWPYRQAPGGVCLYSTVRTTTKTVPKTLFENQRRAATTAAQSRWRFSSPCRASILSCVCMGPLFETMRFRTTICMPFTLLTFVSLRNYVRVLAEQAPSAVW